MKQLKFVSLNKKRILPGQKWTYNRTGHITGSSPFLPNTEFGKQKKQTYNRTGHITGRAYNRTRLYIQYIYFLLDP